MSIMNNIEKIASMLTNDPDVIKESFLYELHEVPIDLATILRRSEEDESKITILFGFPDRPDEIEIEELLDANENDIWSAEAQHWIEQNLSNMLISHAEEETEGWDEDNTDDTPPSSWGGDTEITRRY